MSQNDPITLRVLGDMAQPGRSQRIDLFSKIEQQTGRSLLAYTVIAPVPGTELTTMELPHLYGLISALPAATPIDLMLTTPGGDSNAARMLVEMLRGHGGEFRVIVPQFAMSAGTLIALAGEEIVMGPPSQLGPIDPQIPMMPAPGAPPRLTPAHAIVDGYANFEKEVNERNELRPADYLTARNFDMPLINMSRKLIGEVTELAEKWLSEGQLRGHEDWAKKTALALAENRLNHGTPIPAVQASSEYHLNVKQLPSDDPLWAAIWELFLRSQSFLQQTQQVKLIETRQGTVAVRAMIGG